MAHRLMTRLAAGLVTFAALAVCRPEPVTAADHPNILFIAADDLRNDLGCYGHSLVRTPHLDRLAKRSVVFDRAYCQQAVCNPSRASLMTGRHPDTLRIWDLPTHFRDRNPNVVTLPQHFLKHGYFTQNIGKIYHNWIHEVHGDPDSWSVPAVMHFASHGTDKPVIDGDVPPSSAVDPKCECRDVPDDAYFDGRVASLAVEALQQMKTRDQPFFLAVGFWKPHSPFNAPRRYWDLYERSEIPLPDTPEWPAHAPRIAWHDSREILGVRARSITDDNMREMRHGYLANISYLDAQIGRVLDELDRLQLTQDTIIVFWSDHGYHLGEQTLWAKTSNFELDARVPLMISTPAMVHGGRHTPALAELTDLYPTLAELCGLEAPTGMDGRSLAPVLNHPDASVREVAMTQHPRPAYYDRTPDRQPTHMGYSIRTSTHRYTEWRDWQTGETTDRELYDHVNDPRETVNLADDPGVADIVHRHQDLLNQQHPEVRPGWSAP
ncbi:MAG: sulfatase [Planctomycetaceae bacterium]|nr:sulfatase [Planctomycetaceae bacterium]